MNKGQFFFALLSATLIAVPLRAQSHVEVEISTTAAAKQLALLDRADDRLRHWLATNAETVGLQQRDVEDIKGLLKGWRDYTSLECAFIGTTSGGNSIYKDLYCLICEEGRYVARIRVVKEATDCLKRVLRNPESETLYASTCLEPLTPLKTASDYSG